MRTSMPVATLGSPRCESPSLHREGLDDFPGCGCHLPLCTISRVVISRIPAADSLRQNYPTIHRCTLYEAKGLRKAVAPLLLRCLPYGGALCLVENGALMVAWAEGVYDGEEIKR